MSNLATRVLVAAIGIPVILLLVAAGGFLFFAFIAAAAVLGILELYGLASARGFHPQRGTGILVGLGVMMTFIVDRLRLTASGLLDPVGITFPAPTLLHVLLLVLLLLLPAMMLIELFRGKPAPLANVAVTLFGALYVGLFLGSLVGIRELFGVEHFPVYRQFGFAGAAPPQALLDTLNVWGAATVIVILASIWLCDSAAYFAGRAWGRTKLFERVSPKKTVAGAIAGLLAAAAAFAIGKYVALPYLGLGEALVCGLIVGVFGQLGDLVESLFKRDAGVKDSSTLIPGHGGVLDRFDSLMFVSPLLYVYLDFVVFAA